MQTTPIYHVQDYIKSVSDIINSKNTDDVVITYRGECKEYPLPCVPNIYRDNFLKNYEFFEKNIFDEMKANKISNGEKYIENAISAQHDGFPSRLLDVTYNSLVALYFATTPYYREKEYAYDKYDGRIFIFFIDKMFCPTGENISETYKQIICEKNSFVNHPVFSKNHKLIDHLRINNRIIAQQGAFILFQGKDVDYLPKYMYESIIIPSHAKKDLRNELKCLFGIHKGSIFPEAENLIEEIKKKSLTIENADFNLSNELNILIHNLENEVKYYLFHIFNNANTPHDLIQEFEKNIMSYKLGLEQINDSYGDSEKAILKSIDMYNSIIEDSFEEIDVYFQGKIKTSKKYLKIGEDKNGEKI